MRFYLVATTCLVVPAAAAAQQPTMPAAQASTQAGAQGSVPDAVTPPIDGKSTAQDRSNAADAGIADIVVTASRRAENVQRTALSIQALSSAALTRAGVTRPEDLNAIAPGVSVGTGGNSPQTYIRGVGNYAVNSYAEGAVAYNLDGVYISRSWATRGALFDLDRIEVLKGPQGTLYGRNASGGAINLITARPKLGTTEGFVDLEAGNYDLVRANVAVNLPIGDKAAIRASGQITHRNGYLTDGYDDEKSQSARLRLRWDPTTDVSLIVTGGYQHIYGNGAGAVVNPKLPGTAWRGLADPAVTALFRAQPGSGALLIPPDRTGFVDINVYSIGAELNWNLGPATLTVLPAYRDGTLRDRNFVPGFETSSRETDRQTSLEVRLGNAGEKLKWVVGSYYFDEGQGNIDGEPLLLVRQGVSAQVLSDFRSTIRSYALFGQATYSVTDRIRLTGGARYTYERKTQVGLTSPFSFPMGPACPPGSAFSPNPPSVGLVCRIDVPLSGQLTYRSPTYKAGVEVDLAPQSMVYANYATGFKSGGFFPAAPPNTFRPEKLRALDAGVKNRFFDNRVQLNVEAFYWKYLDHQESHLGPTSVPGVFTFVTENAGRAKSYGADIDLTVLATRNDRFTAKVQYNGSSYDSFIYTNATAAFGPPVTGCAVGPLIAGSQTVDCAGFALVRSPKWTGTVGYDHTLRLAHDASLMLGGRMQFASSSYLSIDFLPTARQQSYATFDTDLTYTAPGGRLSVSGYVRNISNEAVLTQAIRNPFVGSPNPLVDPNGLIAASIRPPRTAGVRVRYDF